MNRFARTGLAPLDNWIATITSPEALAAHQPLSPHASTNDALQAKLADVDRKISALIAAVEAGADLPQLSDQLRRRAAERDGLEAQLRALPRERNLSAEEMREAIAQLGGVAGILATADAAARAKVYQSLGIRLDYDHANRRITASAIEACVLNRVRRGTCPLGTHVFQIDLK